MKNMIKKPLVSVVIPTFKRPIYLKRAIESVLSQTYSNIEIIVVDDNDSDTIFRKETEEVMKYYLKNEKVKYIKHKYNKNGSAARNTGNKNSNGKYITFLDDDDEMLPNRIMLQVKKMEMLDNSWGACYTAYEKIKKNGEILNSSEDRSGNLYIEALMRSLYIGSGSNFLVRKSIVDEINGYDESFNRNQDIEFLTRILEKYKFYYINEITLIVHYEARESKGSYKKIVDIDKFYLDKFMERIDKLSTKDRKRVLSFIALERFRYSIKYKEIYDGIKTLITNKVGINNFIRYCIYMIHRTITKKSYGFRI